MYEPTPELTPNADGDVILYVVVTQPGGVDGRDHTAKGGTVKFASPSKAEAEKHKDNWSTVETRVINFKNAVNHARQKLDPIDLIVLGLGQAKTPRPPATRKTRSS